MKRRTILWSPLLLGAQRAWKSLATNFAGLEPPNSAAPPRLVGAEDTLVLENSNHKLEFEKRSARLLSFRPKTAPDQEFIVSNEIIPAFAIQYLTGEREFRQIVSTDANDVSIQQSENNITAVFSGFDAMDLSATVSVRIMEKDPKSFWTISIRNHANISVTDVQFPFIVVPYNLGGKKGAESLLLPRATGRFWQAPKPEDLEPDSPHAWQFRPENTDTNHYPGLTFAQFLAYYNERAGIYISCQDDSGSIKLIKPVHHTAGGIRLGISHVGDWPASGERELGYDVVLQAFSGDWYDAAEIYRDWSLKQHWAAVPLHQRTDVPDWLLDSPPHIILRIQGELDAGPTDPNQEFLPYRKIIPLLEKISTRIDSPLVAVVMSWERPGPWVYPDCFPPVGGDESLREFTQLASDRGWHVGSFCNGTRWVTHHYWSGYDGEKYFADQHGGKTICMTHDQKPWEENWAQTWRPSYACCLGVARTREIADDFVRRLTDDGLDWVQFLDQNVGCATFPCFAADHEHPPLPGKWMNAAMQSMLDSFKQIAQGQSAKTQSRRQFAFSVEYPPNEFFMPNFQVCDQRIAPPGHKAYGRAFFPLYSFLYHEFVIMQGGFGAAPEPYHMTIRSAYNLVVGQIPGGVMTGNGSLLNRDTFNWAPWSPEVGSNEDSLEMLRTSSALRRGKGREYLVFGRMLRPAQATGINVVHWEYDGQVNNIDAVFHSAWQTASGRHGVVVANWTKATQSIVISDPRLGKQVAEYISAADMATRRRAADQGRISITLPPLSCGLIESI